MSLQFEEKLGAKAMPKQANCILRSVIAVQGVCETVEIAEQVCLSLGSLMLEHSEEFRPARPLHAFNSSRALLNVKGLPEDAMLHPPPPSLSQSCWIR